MLAPNKYTNTRHQTIYYGDLTFSVEATLVLTADLSQRQLPGIETYSPVLGILTTELRRCKQMKTTKTSPRFYTKALWLDSLITFVLAERSSISLFFFTANKHQHSWREPLKVSKVAKIDSDI